MTTISYAKAAIEHPVRKEILAKLLDNPLTESELRLKVSNNESLASHLAILCRIKKLTKNRGYYQLNN